MRFRFGLFEFDDSQFALQRDGTPIHLQTQPARVLACLLRSSNRIVSRDELRKSVWGDSTFVDFNGGLNFCIAQVRSALGDDPASPRYIRTVPKLGYQFIAPAEVIARAEAVDESATKSASARPYSWRTAPSALVLLLLVALAFVAGYQLRATVRGRSLPIIAVARFDNETGDPALTAFADALTDNVVAQLTNTGQGQFSVIGNAQMLRGPRAQRDLAAIGIQLKARYVVLGQVVPAGDQTRILAHLIRLPEQTHLWVARVDLPQTGSHIGGGDVAEKICSAFLPRLAADVRSGYSSPGLGH